jgi:hypothetical protein
MDSAVEKIGEGIASLIAVKEAARSIYEGIILPVVCSLKVSAC